jgi:hypothetical protein
MDVQLLPENQGAEEQSTPQPRGIAKFSKFQLAWYVMVYVNSPIHVDALSASIDFQPTFAQIPPRLPPHFPISALIYVYILLIAAVWNTLVWIVGSVAMSPVWSANEAWGESTHYLAWVLTAWEAMLVLRGGIRKITTMDFLKPEGNAKPAMPIGMACDLVIWNSIQFTIAAKLLQLYYFNDTATLQSVVGVSERQASWIGLSLFVSAWTLALDSALRMGWPFIWSCLGEEFERTAASSFVWTLPQCPDPKAECSICLDSGEDLCELPCKHYFHRDCLFKWFSSVNAMNACPMCRFSLPTSASIGDSV